jgi:hypothetical protein
MSNLIGKATAAVKKVGAMRESMVKNIWLAGLGAYAKSAEEVTTLSARSESLFEELIARGKEMEKANKEKVADVVSEASHSLEQKINGLVQKAAGLDAEQLTAMDKKIDQLTKQIDKLLGETGTPAVKKATTKAKATTAKKPAAKKPAAKAEATESKAPASKAVVARPAPKAPATTAEVVTEKKQD